MSKKMSSKSAKKFNVLDVVVILLIISLIATFVYRIYSGVDKASKQTSGKYVMTFECNEEYDSLLRYLKKGNAVYFATDGSLLGYLYADEESEKGAVYEILEPSDNNNTDNTDEKTESAGSVLSKYKIIKIGGRISLNVDAERIKNGNYYVIGDINITEGSVINVYTDTVEFTLTVKDISLIE